MNTQMSCPGAELLAAYVDGRSGPAESRAIESHLAWCEDCISVVGEALRYDSSTRGTHTGAARAWRARAAWIGGLAAAAAVVFAVAVPRPTRSDTDLHAAMNTFQASLGPYRPFEPRLTSETTYRELAPGTRSAGSAPAASSSMEAAATELLARAREAANATNRTRALGLAHFSTGDARGAIDALQSSTAPEDARALSDLAAAYLARRAATDTSRALEMLERAVVLDPSCVEAWFNLALAAEAEGKTARAIEAWEQSLKLDATSGWSREARANLIRLATR